jgi:4-coumarate--CoA ligase
VPSLNDVLGSGQLLPGIVARVVKADGSLAAYDEPGELVIKSPSLALGYANNAAAFVCSPERVGNILMKPFQYERNLHRWVCSSLVSLQALILIRWCCRWVRTGDEVKIDKNGEVWVLDRLKVFSIFAFFRRFS